MLTALECEPGAPPGIARPRLVRRLSIVIVGKQSLALAVLPDNTHR